MTLFSNIEKNWLRPFLFFGNNPTSLIGGAITSASALTLIGFWVVAIFGHGGSSNPYIGIILIYACLPCLSWDYCSFPSACGCVIAISGHLTACLRSIPKSISPILSFVAESTS